MSIKLMSAIFDAEFYDIPLPPKDPEALSRGTEKPRNAKASTVKLVLLALADHANDYGEGAYPGLTKLERKTALSRQGVIDIISALKYNGLASVADTPSRLGTNNYTININALPAMKKEVEELALSGEVVKPLDQGSQATLPVVVKPLDSIHTLTIHNQNNNNDKKNSVFEKYQSNIGPLTPMIADEITDWIDNGEFPVEWILDAIKSSVDHNKRNLAYVRRCLTNRINGDTYPKKSSDTTRKPESKPRLMPTFVDGVAVFAEE